MVMVVILAVILSYNTMAVNTSGLFEATSYNNLFAFFISYVFIYMFETCCMSIQMHCLCVSQ